MRCLIVLFGCMVTGAFAEIYDFTSTPMPGNLTLSSFYVFHVYAPKSSVEFKNFEVKWYDGKVGIGDYESLQVSLIPGDKLWKLVNKTNFCSAERTLALTGGTELPVFNFKSEENEARSFPLTETDAYILTVSNCGDRYGATVTKGQVIVKQQHGYLPGNKISTLQWWGWFTLVSAFLCIIWAIPVARHHNALVYAQKVIAACTIVALLEAATAYVQYKEWNRSGDQNTSLLAATLLFYSAKYVLILRMLLETAAGSGVTMQRLERRTELKVDVVCSFFLVMQWLWKEVLSYKYRFMLRPTFLMVITIPGTLLWSLFFFWVYRKFHTLVLDMLDKKVATEAVTVFINIRMVLVGSILLATVVLLIQVADILLAATPWNLQWVPYDAAPHLVYTLFLLALMILWWPNADSWRLGYTVQVAQDEIETGGDGKVQAEPIGVAEEAEPIGVAEVAEL